MNTSNEMKMSDHQRKTLAQLIERYGERASLVRHYRNQIAASQTGQSAQQMYVTGMMKRKPTGQ